MPLTLHSAVTYWLVASSTRSPTLRQLPPHEAGAVGMTWVLPSYTSSPELTYTPTFWAWPVTPLLSTSSPGASLRRTSAQKRPSSEVTMTGERPV